jgi:hypothetical protein
LSTNGAFVPIERRARAERFLGGSAESEQALVDGFVTDIGEVQRRNADSERRAGVRRGFHAKLHAGITDAELRVREDLAPDLRNALFSPGAVHGATVRFSNAAGTVKPDEKRDLRGIAIRISLDDGATQDLLLTNAPASQARDARQFMAVAKAFAARPAVLAPVRLVLDLGSREAWRVLGSLRRATARRADSLATESYWSRAPFEVGTSAVKFVLRPLSPSSRPRLEGPDYLREDLTLRLRDEAVRFELCTQRYLDEQKTPIEDGSVEWDEADSPCAPVAELFIPAQDLSTPEAAERGRLVDRMAFSPWNVGAGIRPLGGLNRARKAVYKASVQNRGGGET